MNWPVDSTSKPMNISSASAVVTISDAQADIIRQTVIRHYGFTIKDDWMDQLRGKITARMKLLSAGQFNDYSRTLQKDNKPTAELGTLVEDMLNHESQFNRNPEQLALFKREVLDEWRQQERSSRRIASLGCSTGEEPYSLAIQIEQVLGNNADDVLILGMDLSKRAIEAARRAVYSEFRIRDVSATDRAKYFTQQQISEHATRNTQHGTQNPEHETWNSEPWHVVPRLKNRVRFLQHNLMMPLPAHSLDAIFCNNVLIYFSRQVVSNLLTQFHAALKPNGHLFLGHADSFVSRPDLFQTRNGDGATCHIRRPASQMVNQFKMENEKLEMSGEHCIASPAF